MLLNLGFKFGDSQLVLVGELLDDEASEKSALRLARKLLPAGEMGGKPNDSGASTTAANKG